MIIKEFPNDIIVRYKKEISAKALDWLSFSDSVVNHIENYVIPQYGDKGKDPYSENELIEFLKQIDKYTKRNINGNKRDGQLKLDLLKIAHCAQMAFEKLDDNRHGLV